MWCKCVERRRGLCFYCLKKTIGESLWINFLVSLAPVGGSVVSLITSGLSFHLFVIPLCFLFSFFFLKAHMWGFFKYCFYKPRDTAGMLGLKHLWLWITELDHSVSAVKVSGRGLVSSKAMNHWFCTIPLFFRWWHCSAKQSTNAWAKGSVEGHMRDDCLQGFLSRTANCAWKLRVIS